MRGPWSHSEYYNPSFKNWAVDLTSIYFRLPITYKMNSIIETYWVIVKIKYYRVCWMLHFKPYKNIQLCVQYYPFPKYFLEKRTITSNFTGMRQFLSSFSSRSFLPFLLGNILFGFLLYCASESVSTICFIITRSLKIKMKQY